MSKILYHTFDPVFDGRSRVLVLGSFPSVKSREQGFYYGNPQNRFWRVLSEVFSSPVPQSTEEKKKLLLDCGVALWDVRAELRDKRLERQQHEECPPERHIYIFI